MRGVQFTKMVASGNDFIVIDDIGRNYSKLAEGLCKRKRGVGADGLLVIGKSKKADFSMRIFNADGSQAEMCGNGLRCAVRYAYKHNPKKFKKNISIETIDGIYKANIEGKNKVKIAMRPPKDINLNIPLRVKDRPIKVNYIDIGVPHTVIFVQGIEVIDIESIGRSVRCHKKFKPRGANVDFVEIIDNENIKMRTYERGVEGETLACGTGSVASAIISSFNSKGSVFKVNVHTMGGVLKVLFIKKGKQIKDVFLEGDAKEVYRGNY
ncbi:MAG: diaminopimelate epimerase, partial [Candidatus Omnitrophota bacterium]|jgi:diaminopimelate epimerase|nr:diaminopimelate epimerase [Candidatus Omnitrophota bacterium]